MNTIESDSLRSGRVICLKCGRKGLGYARHPHAFGYKDYEHAECRYCHARFKAIPLSTTQKGD